MTDITSILDRMKEMERTANLANKVRLSLLANRVRNGAIGAEEIEGLLRMDQSGRDWVVSVNEVLCRRRLMTGESFNTQMSRTNNYRKAPDNAEASVRSEQASYLHPEQASEAATSGSIDYDYDFEKLRVQHEELAEEYNRIWRILYGTDRIS